MLRKNLILNTDSYKFSHYLQYPEGTVGASAYIEPRVGGRFNQPVFFGLQMFLMEYLSTPITAADIDEAEQMVTAHGLPFNREGWEIILKEYAGYLPIEIQAVPEGTVMDLSQPQVQVIVLDSRLPWLATYIETALIRAVWYPSTVATLSREAKKIIYAGLKKTSDDPDAAIMFKLHDFGARGATSNEAAGIGGCAHLVNFMGTDTFEAIRYAKAYYGEPMAGFSIPAAEHSTVTSWGRSGEAAMYANMVDKFGGEGKLVAVVSDSYDLWNAVSNIWGKELKSKVIGKGGTLVVRPDSGDPTTVPVQVLQRLDAAFGSSRTQRGAKILNPAVRVIQGDGMTLDTIKQLVQNVIDAGFSIDNIAFGMGGGLLQKVDRDTQRYAMKLNEIELADGTVRPVSKAPVTDPTKGSKAGRVKGLPPVWRCGKLLVNSTLGEARERAKIS